MPRLLAIAHDILRGNAATYCLERHFQRLSSDGWKVLRVVPHLKASFHPKCGETLCIPLPPLRFLPPSLHWLLKHPFAARLYSYRMAKHILKKMPEIVQSPPDVVLTTLVGLHPWLALHLAHALNCPLGIIIYDEQEAWEDSPRISKWLYRQSGYLLSHADHVWTVTPELADCYRTKTGFPVSEKTSAILPLPACLSAEMATHRPCAGSVLAYAGDFFPERLHTLRWIAEGLAPLGGSLLILAPARRLHMLQEFFGDSVPWTFKEFFPSPEEGIEYLLAHANALLVGYGLPPHLEQISLTSFPSKLVEFSHLQMPIVIITPEEAALGRWARDNEWPLVLTSYDILKRDTLLARLSNAELWREDASRVRDISETHFKPEKIHHQFQSKIPV